MASNGPDPSALLGIPVEGDLGTFGSDRSVEQWPIESFRQRVEGLLHDPTIDSFGWRQYIPTFNDGDPCLFTTSSFWVKPKEDPDQSHACEYHTTSECDCRDDYAEFYEFDSPQGNLFVGGIPRDWNPETKQYESGEYTGPDKARYERILSLYEGVEGGHYEAVLRQLFGYNVELVFSATDQLIRVTEYGPPY